MKYFVPTHVNLLKVYFSDQHSIKYFKWNQNEVPISKKLPRNSATILNLKTICSKHFSPNL